MPSASLVPRELRPVGAAHDRRDAAVQALLPRRGGAAVAAPDLAARSLPHDRHRERGHDRPAPHLLRDARQLLDRRLLQAGRGRVRLRAVDAGLRVRPESESGSRVFGGDEELGLGPDEEAIECWRAVGVPDERIVPPRPRGQLLAVGPDRAVRPVLGALPRPRARLRPRGATGRATTPSASSSSGTSSSCSTSCRPDGSLPDAARAEHRHRHGARPDGGDPPGRPVGLRDRPLPAARRARRGAVGPALRRRTSRPPARAADPRRPRPRGGLPARRRRRARRTRTAATSCAGSCGGRSSRAACSASRSRSCPALRARGRGDGRRLPGAATGVADHRALGARRGGGLRPHARRRASGCSPS